MVIRTIETARKKKVVTVSSFNEQFCISTMLHALLSLVSMKDVKFTADNAKKKDFFFLKRDYFF